ncbi:MAG: glycosyltransferase family 4 protein [Candidatus Marsarchaeota archaeon]|nr:glycosyltransferase family 4 protein [Candidatus Marsarchaeota archaeon]
MDICVLNPFFYPFNGGTEKVLLELYRRLARRHNVCVISASLKPGKDTHTEHIDGIKVVRLRTRYLNLPGLPLPFLAMSGIKDRIEKEGAEIYHINNRYQYFFGSVNAIRRTGGKLAMTIHNSLPSGIGPLTDAGGMLYDIMQGRKTMHAADLITGVSRDTIDATVPKADLWKSHVVYNGVDSRRFRRLGHVDRRIIAIRSRFDGLPIVLNNGRLTQQKGQTYLMDAVSRMEEKVGLVFIGTGPLETTLRERASNAGLKGRFSILNGIPEDELPLYYNAADVFVLPSLYEPAGLALLEALASETPSVASRVGGIPEMMGRCGLYAKPKDINGIRERVEFALSHHTAMHRLAVEGRKRMLKFHDWDGIAKQYERLFEETIRR